MKDWKPPYYQTECEHKVTSYHPVDCQHGSLTGTYAQPPTGRVYHGVLVEAVAE